MDSIFSSDDFHPRDRFAVWHEVACKTIVQHCSTPNNALTFFAELRAAGLDDVGLLDVKAAPMMVERTRQHIEQADHDDYLLCLQRSGKVSFQGTKDLVLRAGQATLLDPSRTYVGHFDGCSNMLVVRLPRQELDRRIGAAASLILSSITSSSDLEMTSSILGSIVDGPSSVSPPTSSLLRDSVLDLVAISLSRMFDGTVKVSNSRQRIKDRLSLAISRNLNNPEFSGEDAARIAGVSVRYANVLLSDENTSLSRAILAKRLQRCADALSDPTQHHRSIQDIAFSWGFSDQGHFGRRFKSAYGLAPKDFRRRALLRED